MDKHEYRLKTEQMTDCLQKKSYDKAREIAESIDWKKVKNVTALCEASEIYEYFGEYRKSRDILFLAYNRAPDSKKIIYRLGTLAIKLGQLKEASDCYDEFTEVAPKDPNRYILKYKLLQAKKAPIKEQIEALEEFKSVEYVEKWAFELARLYQEAGMIPECIEECEDLILWFSDGKYVYKAMELKMKYKPLTPLQQAKYDEKFKSEGDVPAETSEGGAAEETSESEKPEETSEPEEKTVEPEPEEPKPEETSEPEMPEEKTAEPEPGEKGEEILSDDVRKLMEELEEESADIDAWKSGRDAASGNDLSGSGAGAGETSDTGADADDTRSLLRKAVESLSAQGGGSRGGAQDMRPIEPESGAAKNDATSEEDGITLGDSQSMALVAKALENAARVDIDESAERKARLTEDARQQKDRAPYDTDFTVRGKYDLDARSDVGLEAGLTEEQKKLFSYFVPVHGMSEQIVKALRADMNCKNRYGTSKTGNLLIVGRAGSGKTVLAVNMVKAIQKSRKFKQGKVAIVKAESLNRRDAGEVFDKLHGGAIIIERASRLSRETIDRLGSLMEGQTGELLVILEDERKPLDRLLTDYPEFGRRFTSRIELPVFISDELVTFGQTYAKENGYKIDEMGILALYSDIDILQREERVVTVTDVKGIVDKAIEKAGRKNFFKKLFGNNRDEAGRIILREKNFK